MRGDKNSRDKEMGRRAEGETNIEGNKTGREKRLGDSGRLFPAISNPLPQFHPSVPGVDCGAMHHP